MAEGRIALAERCVDVRPLGRGEEIRTDRLLQALRGGGVVSGSRLGEADRYACAERRGRVAGRNRVIEDLLENALGLFGIVRQAKLKLRIGEPELALVDLAEVGSCLEVLHRDTEFSSELPESLDGGTACPGLDPRDVGVRDARGRELALRKLPFEPQSAQALPD